MNITSVNKNVGKFMNWTTKKLSGQLEQGLKNPAQYAAKLMVISFISKDAINCALYTAQSYNNKKIPEDKRGFVASLDFFNGIINVGGQLLAFMAIDRLLTPKLETLYTGVFKNPKNGKETYVKSTSTFAKDNIEKLTKEVIKEKKNELAKNVDLAELTKNVKTVSDNLIEKLGHSSSKGKEIITGLGILVTALATNAFIKRTVTPLIATPMAGWFKNKYMDKNKPNTEPDRVYYEWATTGPKYNNGLDKTTFSKVNSKQL